MVTAEITVVPIGTGTTSISRYIAAFVKELKKNKKTRIELTGMGTQVEVESLRDVFEAIEKAREKVFEAGAKRVVLQVVVDERRDKESSLKQKKNSVNSKI